MRNYLIGYLRKETTVHRRGIGSVNYSLELPKGTPVLIIYHEESGRYTAEYLDAANKLVEIKLDGSIFRKSESVGGIEWIRVKPLQ